MKKYTMLLISFVVLILFSGCDYYSDAYISVTYPHPDIIGVNEYEACISEKKNSARIFLLSYPSQGYPPAGQHGVPSDL